jgi:hypothetical protein
VAVHRYGSLIYIPTLLIIGGISRVDPYSFVAFRMWSENALVSPSPSCCMVYNEGVGDEYENPKKFRVRVDLSYGHHQDYDARHGIGSKIN